MRSKAAGVGLAVLLFLCCVARGSATSLGVIGFQLADAAAERAASAIEASGQDKGWEVSLADAQGSGADLSAQILKALGAGANALILVKAPLSELAGPLKEAAAKKVPVISVMSGTSPGVLMDVTVNEYVVGAELATELLGLMTYTGSVAMVRDQSRVATRIRGKLMDLVLARLQQ